MAKAINLGELAIAIALKTGALEQGLNEVKKQLNKHSKDVQSSGASYDKLALVAGVAFYKIASAIKSSVSAFNDFNNSMVGLKSVVQGTGNDFGKAQNFIDGFTKDGLVPAADAAASLKNLLSHGFNMDQAADVMNRFKDSASFARQGALSMGEAIKGGTEGLKNSMSMMVDNTGVTENLSVMWDKYAKTIGKTGATLSDAEKIQAEYAGVMRATAFQVGDAAKYSEQFAGAQSRNAAETLKLSQAFGASLVPILNQVLNILTPLVKALTNFINSHKELVGAVAIGATAILGLATAFTVVMAAVKLLTPAMAALDATFLANPVGLIVLGIAALAGVIGLAASAATKAKNVQIAYNKELAEHNKLVQEGINKSQVTSEQSKIDELKKLAESYNELNKKIKEQEEIRDKAANDPAATYDAVQHSSMMINKYKAEISRLIPQMKEWGSTEKDINRIIKEKENAIKEASRVTATDYNEQAKSIAQRRTIVIETQNLIDSYKKAEKGSDDWHTAQKKLSDAFPQFSSNSGIAVDAIQEVTTAQDLAVKAEWTLLQAKIKMSRMELETILDVQQAKVDLAAVSIDLSSSDAGITSLMIGNLQKATDKLNGIKADIAAMKNIEGIDIDKIMGVAMPDITKKTSAKSYTNEALDSALKIMEHKKHMNQLTLENEISTMQSIKKKYANNADERMSLDEKIYDAKQAIIARNKTASEKAIDDQEKAFEKSAADLAARSAYSQSWIDREKLTGNLTGQEEIDAYNRIIKYHQEYLKKVSADTENTDEQKKKALADETEFIKSQQDKIYEIQKTSVEKAVNAYIDAKKKQYATEENLEDDRLNKKLKALDKEYSDKESSLKTAERNTELSSLYDEERKYQNAATKEGQDKLKDIRDKISSLNKEATQDALSAEKESRKLAIDQELSDNKDKYKKLNEDLATEGTAMIASSASYAKLANDEIIKGQGTIANSLKSIMTNFDKETNTLVTTGMENLRKLIESYKTLMDGISLKPLDIGLGKGPISPANSTLKNGTSVTINDYGNKILSGIGEIQDYGKELVTGANNATRG